MQRGAGKPACGARGSRGVELRLARLPFRAGCGFAGRAGLSGASGDACARALVRAFRGERFGGFAKVVGIDKGGIVLISSKGRYALRLAVCIAQAGPEAKVSLREVAEHEELSLKYLEQIARPMVSAGLLASVRGKGGGYRLARDPQDILAGDVLRAVEGTTVPVTCAALDGPEPCHRADVCTTVRFWAGLDEVIEKYVDGVTVGDLADAPQPHIEIAE